MATPSTGTTKTIYLIRHAESEENERLASLVNVFSSFYHLSLPSTADIYSSFQLLNIPAQVDSAVSEKGKQQIEDMAGKLTKADFVKQVELVAHSPLHRARHTSRGLLECMAPNLKHESVKRVVETDLLREKYPSEWIPGYYATFQTRIDQCEEWLLQQPEDNIVLVGHSQFFKAMLGLDYKFGNCDVWQAELTLDESSRKWINLKQLFTCELE
jgi:broad specificity phosphatase PhoE